MWGQIVVLGLWLMGIWGFAQIIGVYAPLPPYHAPWFYTVSQKNCAFLFLLELRKISTNFNTFW